MVWGIEIFNPSDHFCLKNLIPPDQFWGDHFFHDRPSFLFSLSNFPTGRGRGGSGDETNPRWDWLGLACETNTKDARIIVLMSSLSKGSFASQIQRAAWIAKAISAAVGSG